MLLSSSWLKELDFEVHFQQVQTDPLALVLLSWPNVEVFAVCPSERPQFYVDDDAFG